MSRAFDARCSASRARRARDRVHLVLALSATPRYIQLKQLRVSLLRNREGSSALMLISTMLTTLKQCFK